MEDPNMGVARQYHHQMVHFLRKTVVFGDNGVAKTVGVLPAGAQIVKAMSGVAVSTVFNAGTTNTLNIGTSADDDLYGTLLALGTTTFVPLDEAVSNLIGATETTITATVVLTGTAATTGSAEVIIAYIPDTDG
jgi:hypothetical protein